MGFFYPLNMTSIVTTTENSICLYIGKDLLVEIKRDKPTNTTNISLWFLGINNFDGHIHSVGQVQTAKYSADEIEQIGIFLVAMAHDMKREATT